MKNLLIPPVFVFISLLLIVGSYFLFKNLNIIPFPFNFLGILIAFPGFVLAGKTHDLFKKYNTTLGFEKSSYFITEDVFKRTRNPMYLGMFLFLLGLSICFCNVFSMCVPFVFIIAVGIIFIPAEEKILEETFGKQYSEYKKTTRRWI